ncbi:hypothetical protein TTRE_0000383001 [Trichuris trichiura]|uniref:Uncharacterized protein n=1 Tax=Trichuris trichiura TaxID=36087 RepID=A0A077Z4Y0_TRITR|nr:hypothetical protein TTRE_0000383001 [Trichuris trichiura]
MLLLLLLGALTHLLSAVPVNEHELLRKETEGGPDSSVLVKRSLDKTFPTGYEQHAELERGHLVRLKRIEESEPHAFLPVDPEQHQERFKRGLGKKIKKKWRSVKKHLPKQPIPIIRYERSSNYGRQEEDCPIRSALFVCGSINGLFF